MPLGIRSVRRVLTSALALTASAALLASPVLALAAGSQAKGPDLVKGTAYLTAPANLIGGHYYRSFSRAADFGLTLDGALALAATGTDDRALTAIVTFLDQGGKDASGKTIDEWTGIGTRFASGGAIGKEALLAEVVGDNSRHFGGHDLIAALDTTICARPEKGADSPCPAAGSYAYASSVFDQALGIIAQLRAGQITQAARPVAYLEHLQNADGSFPSVLPGTGQDVDSTAMAVMALALVQGKDAAARVVRGVAWIAGRQEKSGGFPGAGGDSINSAGLAIQAMTLEAEKYRARIAATQRFLASEQNANGGFNPDAGGQHGSDLRASAQALSGAVGVSFGTLRRDLAGPAARSASAQEWRVGACTAATGVVVAVDFSHWGGPVLRSCGTASATGFALLNRGGWHTAGTEHDGPGFICRIGYNGFRKGTQYPTPAADPCVLTPPASAYWTDWLAGPGQDTWSYSQAGALSDHLVPGTVNLWVFGGTNLSGTSGSALPDITPDSIRSAKVSAAGTKSAPAIVNATPVAASDQVSHGTAGPAIVAVIIAILLLAVAGTVAVRRRIKAARP